MEKLVTLKAEVREKRGSRAARAIRKDGRLPATIYGHKKEALTISLNAREFMDRVHHGMRLLDIELGSKKETVMIKDLQYDHIGKEAIHADLIRVDISEKVKVAVAIELKGVAKGAADGGIVEARMAKLEIECLATEIPESVVVSVKELGIGDTIHAKDIQLPEGVKLVSDGEALVATCSVVVAVKTTEELLAEQPIAPEVIGAKKEEEGEEGAEVEEEKKEKK